MCRHLVGLSIRRLKVVAGSPYMLFGGHYIQLNIVLKVYDSMRD